MRVVSYGGRLRPTYEKCYVGAQQANGNSQDKTEYQLSPADS